MKKIKTIVLVLLLFNQLISAQESSLKNGFSLGFHVAQYQRDFAVGLNLTSPMFAHESVGIRLRANMAFLDHVTPQLESTWTPYTHLSLGMVGIGGLVTEKIRVYGEGGVVVILPSTAFSSEDVSVGGYGLFGFEFFMAPFVNYFIEIGGIGTGAVADRVPTKPIYSNGLIVTAGFRFTL